MENYVDDRIRTERSVTDAIFLITLLPEDVWSFILLRVQDDHDLRNLSNASLYFRDLLYPNRVEFLFSMVMGFLINPLLNPKQCLQNKQHNTLDLRLVCRGWKKAIDSFYCTFPLRGSIESSRISKFLSHFKHTHHSDVIAFNPFLARAINITIRRIRSAFRDQPALVNLLKVYGNHIWNCIILFEDPDWTGRTSSHVLTTCLTLMPNLKAIFLDYKSNGTVTRTGLYKQTIESNLVPKYENLKIIKTRNLPTNIFHAFIKANKHIEILDVIKPSKIYYSLTPLQNLKEMSTEICVDEDTVNLEKLLNRKFPIFKVRIADDRVDFTKILSLIGRKWGKSLTDITIEMPKAVFEDDYHMYNDLFHLRSLDLPILQQLTIKLRHIVSLDLLLPTRRSLERLHLIFMQPCNPSKSSRSAAKREKAGHLLLLSCLDNIPGSNIWIRFDKLREISCCYCSTSEKRDLPRRTCITTYRTRSGKFLQWPCNCN